MSIIFNILISNMQQIAGKLTTPVLLKRIVGQTRIFPLKFTGHDMKKGHQEFTATDVDEQNKEATCDINMKLEEDQTCIKDKGKQTQNIENMSSTLELDFDTMPVIYNCKMKRGIEEEVPKTKKRAQGGKIK